MEAVGNFEFNKKDLIGHGAFAVVFRGRHRDVQYFVFFLVNTYNTNLSFCKLVCHVQCLHRFM